MASLPWAPWKKGGMSVSCAIQRMPYHRIRFADDFDACHLELVALGVGILGRNPVADKSGSCRPAETVRAWSA